MSPSAPQLPQVPGAGQRAREQADAYESVFAPTLLTLDNGDVVSIPPHPNLSMLDDAGQEAYEDLLMEAETYDREPDIYIPEQRLRGPDGNENGVVLPAETKQGALKNPYRKGGVRITPAWRTQVVMAALGPQKYAQLTAGGKSAGDVWSIWNEQSLRVADRQNFRSSLNGRPSPVVPISR